MKKFFFKKKDSSYNKDILNLPFALREISTSLSSYDKSNNNDISIENNQVQNSSSSNENINMTKIEELKFGNINSINEINLCKNNLIKIYPNIGFLTLTTTLKLCCNSLIEIPTEIGYMKHLKNLDVSNNKIEQIPGTICYLNELETLNFANNKISEISIILKKLTNLTQLNLKGNQIEIIPSEISELNKLVYLNLSENPIHYLPIEINRIHTLAELIVENCPLVSSIEDCQPAFILSSEMKDLIIFRNQKLLLESSKFQNNASLDMLNELEQYKKYYSNSSSLSLTCEHEQNVNNFSIFDFNNSLNKNFICHCHFFNDILLNKNIRINSSSTTLNQEIETESVSLNSNDNNDGDDNSTIEEPINYDNKIELKIPSLKELAARVIVRNHLLMPTHILQDDLLYYLSSYKTCSFCHGPYFETYIRRVRVMHKEGKEIPFEYRLCSAHFNSNEERIKEMFKIRPITAPRSLNISYNKQDKKFRYKENDLITTSENSSCNSLSNLSQSSSNTVTYKANKLFLSSSSSNIYKKNSMKYIFNLKSKSYHHKSSKSIDYVHSINSNSSNSNKRNYYKNEYEVSSKPVISNSVTVNELLSMKQPSLPILIYPSHMSNIKNI